MTRTVARSLAGIGIAFSMTATATAVQVFHDEATFQQQVVAPTTVSFNAFPAGSEMTGSTSLGAVTVELTGMIALIFGPGPFLGFTTNFMSVGAQESLNDVIIHLPADTRAAGMKIASIHPVAVTATPGSGPATTISFSASQVSFLGFTDPFGLQQITISSPFNPQMTPIVNVGDITYASGLNGPPAVVTVPTLSEAGLVVLVAILLCSGLAVVRRRAFG